MKSLKVILVVIACLLKGQHASSQTVQTLEDIKRNLIQITQKLQTYEVSLLGIEKEIKLLKSQEREVFTLIAKQQHILASALQSLQHWREYSPILIALSSVSLDDLVHSFLVLQSCAPRLEKQNRSILETVKMVVELRGQIQKQTDDYTNLKGYYQEGLKFQADLFEAKFQECSLPETPVVKKLHERAEELKSAPLHEILAQLASLFSKTEIKKESELKLVHIAVGEPFQECKGASCPPSAKSNPLAIKISTRGEAQVVSPCDATVIYIGSHLEKSQMVILKKDEYFIVLSGLGSVNCRIGENILEGEPIGCALSGAANELHKDFKNEEKIISLQLLKGMQFIDSTPYLRSIPNDKKI